jgi:hypothetical protein
MNIDASLARAATTVIALIGAHSLVDYPLRTGAIMAIVAFSCGLLVTPLTGAPGELPDQTGAAGRASTARRPARRPADRAHADAPISQHPPERWGNDIEWPSEWR